MERLVDSRGEGGGLRDQVHSSDPKGRKRFVWCVVDKAEADDIFGVMHGRVRSLNPVEVFYTQSFNQD